jgi:putative hemolysin
VLTTTLIGNHAANTAVAVVTALIVEDAFGNLLVSVAVAMAVVAILALGELTPRSFAKTHAESVAPLLMPLVLATWVLTFPIVFLFTRFSHVLVRAVGGTITRSGPFVTEEDITYMIRLGHKEGVIDKQEGKMLASIIELGDTLVREVMIARTDISALPLSATADEVLHEASHQGHSRMPVYDESLDEVRGFFHTKDLLHFLSERKSFQLKDHLRPVLFVPELMKVSDLLKLFQKKKTHLAIVVDEYGGTAGLVALEDVLEEIVGPIQDEHDEDDVPLRRVDDAHYVAEGRAGIYDVAELLGVSFPDDAGYETLGGFLIAHVGHMPVRGQRVSLQGWNFIVRDADEKHVARIDIERAGSLPPAGAATGHGGERAERSDKNLRAPGPDGKVPAKVDDGRPVEAKPNDLKPGDGKSDKADDERPRPRIVKSA